MPKTGILRRGRSILLQKTIFLPLATFQTWYTSTGWNNHTVARQCETDGTAMGMYHAIVRLTQFFSCPSISVQLTKHIKSNMYVCVMAIRKSLRGNILSIHKHIMLLLSAVVYIVYTCMHEPNLSSRTTSILPSVYMMHTRTTFRQYCIHSRATLTQHAQKN
jgi:hypothetical protein